ncbi:MAG: hypothetical protein LBH97_06745 [Treponema sp.]|jgi:hypothetical protein|nr:hypothetical protein [Treponema sp.]
MDERKKQIETLEQRKRENRASLDVLLVHLGETLLRRLGDLSAAETAELRDIEEYRRLHSDISGSEAAIQTVEEQLRRFRELEENIAAAEQEDSDCSTEMSVFFGKLGKMLLDESTDNPAYADFTASWREQADALRIKIRSLEDRLYESEHTEGGNVFTWIGKNAQGLVLRSFLTKSQDSLEQLYRTVGERYSRRDTQDTDTALPVNGLSSAEIDSICAVIEGKRAEARSLADHLAGLREERRGISRGFSAEGDPSKQIQTLKKHIVNAQDELKVLYRRIGAEAAAITTEDFPQRKQAIDSLIRPEDRESLDKAAQLNQAMIDDEAAAGRLRASLAIDEEKSKIEKCRKMIEDKKIRIADAERDITEFENRIKKSENQIEELQKLL